MNKLIIAIVVCVLPFSAAANNKGVEPFILKQAIKYCHQKVSHSLKPELSNMHAILSNKFAADGKSYQEVRQLIKDRVLRAGNGYKSVYYLEREMDDLLRLAVMRCLFSRGALKARSDLFSSKNGYINNISLKIKKLPALMELYIQNYYNPKYLASVKPVKPAE